LQELQLTENLVQQGLDIAGPSWAESDSSTRDAGATWTPRGNGLPTENAYLTILREAFDSRGEGGAR